MILPQFRKTPQKTLALSGTEGKLKQCECASVSNNCQNMFYEESVVNTLTLFDYSSFFIDDSYQTLW